MIKRGQIYQCIYAKFGRSLVLPRFCIVLDPCGYKRRVIVQTCDANGRPVKWGVTRGLKSEYLEFHYCLHRDVTTVEKRSDDTKSAGLNSAMNQYQPRQFPTDTPEEKRARAQGFEAGRQYEASLRDADVCQDEGCPHFGTDHIHVKAPA